MKQDCIVKHFVSCPECSYCSESAIDHLNIGETCRWYCPKCGKQYKFTVNNDNTVDIELTEEHFKYARILLKLQVDGALKPIYFIVRAKDFYGGLDWQNMNQDRRSEIRKFHYEESTCPVNFLRDTEQVYYDGDDDPHGLWEVVGHSVMKDEDISIENFGIKLKEEENDGEVAECD